MNIPKAIRSLKSKYFTSTTPILCMNRGQPPCNTIAPKQILTYFSYPNNLNFRIFSTQLNRDLANLGVLYENYDSNTHDPNVYRPVCGVSIPPGVYLAFFSAVSSVKLSDIRLMQSGVEFARSYAGDSGDGTVYNCIFPIHITEERYVTAEIKLSQRGYCNSNLNIVRIK